MRTLLLATIGTVLLVGCGTSPTILPSPEKTMPPVSFQEQLTETVTTSFMSSDTENGIPIRYSKLGWLEIGRISGTVTPGPPTPTDARTPLINLLLFSNASCAYCRTFEARIDALISDPSIGPRLAVHVLPLHLMKYPQAEDAALTLYCAEQLKGAAGQGRRLLLSRPLEQITEKDWTDIGLNADALTTCKKSPWAHELYTNAQDIARVLDVSLVPTYFINGVRYVGLPEESELKDQILRAMSR